MECTNCGRPDIKIFQLTDEGFEIHDDGWCMVCWKKYTQQTLWKIDVILEGGKR